MRHILKNWNLSQAARLYHYQGKHTFMKNYIFLLLLLCSSILLAQTIDVQLSWDAVSMDTTGNPEPGHVYYNIYAADYPTFTPDSTTFLMATWDTQYTHTISSGKNYFYQIKAIDEWGNQSILSETKGTATWVLLQLQVFLEGAYDADGDTMKTALNDAGVIPLTSPYSGTERTVSEIPAGVVDWVVVELRSIADGSTLTRQAYFLRKDGKIIEIDGSGVELGIADVADGDYYIIIRHRNHLAVMSKISQTLSKSSAASYTFIDAAEKYYNDDAIQLSATRFGMYSSDANGNGQIQNDDKNDYWRLQVGTAGYKSADFNLNGQVQNDDKNDFWRLHVGNGTSVP